MANFDIVILSVSFDDFFKLVPSSTIILRKLVDAEANIVVQHIEITSPQNTDKLNVDAFLDTHIQNSPPFLEKANAIILLVDRTNLSQVNEVETQIQKIASSLQNKKLVVINTGNVTDDDKQNHKLSFLLSLGLQYEYFTVIPKNPESIEEIWSNVASLCHQVSQIEAPSLFYSPGTPQISTDQSSSEASSTSNINLFADSPRTPLETSSTIKPTTSHTPDLFTNSPLSPSPATRKHFRSRSVGASPLLHKLLKGQNARSVSFDPDIGESTRNYSPKKKSSRSASFHQSFDESPIPVSGIQLHSGQTVEEKNISGLAKTTPPRSTSPLPSCGTLSSPDQAFLNAETPLSSTNKETDIVVNVLLSSSANGNGGDNNSSLEENHNRRASQAFLSQPSTPDVNVKPTHDGLNDFSDPATTEETTSQKLLLAQERINSDSELDITKNLEMPIEQHLPEKTAHSATEKAGLTTAGISTATLLAGATIAVVVGILHPPAGIILLKVAVILLLASSFSSTTSIGLTGYNLFAHKPEKITKDDAPITPGSQPIPGGL